MDNIVIVEGDDARDLVANLRRIPEDVYRLRFAIDGGGIKIKLNEGVWSPPYGTVQGSHDEFL